MDNRLEPIVKVLQEQAEATFEDGILKLRIPRAEEVKPRQIRINPTHDGKQVASPVTSDAGKASSESRTAR